MLVSFNLTIMLVKWLKKKNDYKKSREIKVQKKNMGKIQHSDKKENFIWKKVKNEWNGYIKIQMWIKTNTNVNHMHVCLSLVKMCVKTQS